MREREAEKPPVCPLQAKPRAGVGGPKLKRPVRGSRPEPPAAEDGRSVSRLSGQEEGDCPLQGPRLPPVREKGRLDSVPDPDAAFSPQTLRDAPSSPGGPAFRASFVPVTVTQEINGRFPPWPSLACHLAPRGAGEHLVPISRARLQGGAPTSLILCG